MLKLALSIILSFILISLSLDHNLLAFDPIPSWNITTNLLYPNASHTSIQHNNSIVIINGSAATAQTHDEVIRGLIDPITGAISNWSYGSNTPEPVIWHATSANTDHVYMLGGYPDGVNGNINTTNSVYFSIMANPELSWTNTTQLPLALSLGASAIHEQKIYYAGGFERVNGSIEPTSNKIFMSTINPDGTLDSWEELELTLPNPLIGFGLVATNGKLVVIGGTSNITGSIVYDEVYTSDINPDGTLEPWFLTHSLPQDITRSGIVKAGNLIISAGGATKTGMIDNVYYTTINEDGTINPWQESPNSLPQPLCCGSLAASDTHIYYTGGHNPPNYYDTVYYTEVDTGLPDDENILDVVDTKQYDPLWSQLEYDTASLWSPNPTIERWGCALTSASMVLNYYGHTTNPTLLNNWLNSQDDGYIGNGLVNWLAISRLTSLNTIPELPTLEFVRHNADDELLTNELLSEKPAILNVPGHFLVAKGVSGDDFVVNDPASTNTLLSEVEADHEGNYSNILSFTPSNTDLSYIMLLAASDTTIEVYNQDDNLILDGYHTLPPLMDDINGNLGGEPLNQFLLAKPEDGIYKIELSGNITSSVSAYLYNEDGKVMIKKLNPTENSEETYFLYYINDFHDVYTDILGNLLTLLVSGKDDIRRVWFYNLFLKELGRTNKYLLTNNTLKAKTMLNTMYVQVSALSNTRLIAPDFANELLLEIDAVNEAL